MPTRYDPDVWIREREDKSGHDYIGTHTDDLMIVAKDPKRWMNAIQAVYTVKSIGPPEFHLGCDYKQCEDGTWMIGTKTYVAEALKKVTSLLGLEPENPREDGNYGKLGTEKTPMVSTLKPELDASNLCSLEDHRLYQQLIGISQWLITCGRLDLCFAVNSLSRFNAAPREGHLKAATRIFKYLNKHPEKWIHLDPNDLVHPGEATRKFESGKLKDIYQDAKEEMDSKFPAALMKPLSSTIFYDSNFAHDETTRRSVTGIIGFLGSTPIMGYSKRQGAIATSTYGAEMCAAKVAAEEAIGLRYMLRSLGVRVEGPTKLIGDNQGQLDSITNPGSLCQKKHSQVAFHFVRECEAAEICRCYKIGTDYNLSDPMTKAGDANMFWRHFGFVFGAPRTRVERRRKALKRSTG